MSSRESKRKPPPNYFSRRVQTKLLMLVGMFMVVVILMVEAGKPENWAWMFAGQQGVPESDNGLDPARQTPDDETPDAATPDAATPNRAENGRSPSNTGPESGAGLGASMSRSALSPAFLAEMGVDDSDPLTRTQVDGWRRVLKKIPADSERTFRKGLRAVRASRELSADEGHSWDETVLRLDTQWTAYHDEALESLADGGSGLNADQRGQWLTVLGKSKDAWEKRFLPALQSVTGGDRLADAHRESLDQSQRLLDELALSLVEDNTVLRPADRVAWFRALELLGDADPDALKRASTASVSYLQLYKQPRVYRGKLVTVRGQARLAYHVQAPKNLYGIPGYYIFWLKPAAGPNSPLVVYSLQKPAGFPEIKDKDRDRETTPLVEDVEFTGYFFKRWAYRARDGANTAPLLLALSPHWEAQRVATGDDRRLPSTGFLLLAVLVSITVACLVAVTVYVRGRNSAVGSWYKHSDNNAPERLRELSHDDLPTPMEATIRTLADQDRVSKHAPD